ncbi:MAG TPA: MiaB/RimO family radical SAM methylthiotransferase [Terracidiphilus sp.]|jgi:threonylcarbamoyladenosine tRNA methylthiotransferase MtaB|nr:MiaB/RimO family radical SAM methylthiotransferase [Terracidiphilus sp.]
MGAAFHIENFGCRAARADGEAVGERLRAAGLAEGHSSAVDVVVVNTCSVTAEADREARAYIRRAHRANPEARIVVTGCYAQRAPEELAGLPGVAAVVGNSHKALAPDIAAGLARLPGDRQAPAVHADFVPVHTLIRADSSGSAGIWADDRFAHSFLEESQVVPGTQTRPNLKIQEGCGNRCTFCVIPQTRGGSRSLAEEKVLAQVRGFVQAGGKELLLSGINLGRWGRDISTELSVIGHCLARLVRRIFRETDLPRLRLSSIEPMDWDADLIALMREFGGTRLARHAHLPLQSGSDTVLRRMHRRYRPWHYAEKVWALVGAAGSELTLGADVMAGFPGETDAEFEETLQLIRQLPFGYLHLFPFSPRPATRGWELHRQSPVPAAVVEERMAMLRALGREKMQAHRSRFVGRELECITLHSSEAQRLRLRTAALTENFLPVEVEASMPANQAVRLRISGIGVDAVLLATAPCA